MTSFYSIYQQYFDFVWTSVRRLGVSPDAADDVVQDVFVIIHDRVDTLRQPELMRSWIYGVVRRVVSHYHRAQRARMASMVAVTCQLETTQSLTPFDESDQNDKVRKLRSVLEQMDDRKREVFVMAELEELTVPEIAEILGIPLNTAYSRLRAARREFEDILASRVEQDGKEPGRVEADC